MKQHQQSYRHSIVGAVLICFALLGLGLTLHQTRESTTKPVQRATNPLFQSQWFEQYLPSPLALTNQSLPTNKAPIVLGTSAAFKGTSRALGIELYRGAMAYFEQVNRQGGINGRPIVIRTYDDGYDPIPTIDNTIKLIEEDDVLLLFNYVGTPTVTRMLPLLNHYRDRQIQLFFPFTGAQPQRQFPYHDLVFNLRASYRQETEGLVENFVKIGRQRIAYFYQIDAYGRSGWDGVKRGLAKHNLDIVEEATYKRGTDYSDDLTQQVENLRQAKPDAIIAVGSYAACAAFIRDVREADWDIPIAVISFVGSESLLELLQTTTHTTGIDYTQNLISSQVVPSYEERSLPAVQEYHQLMEQDNLPLPQSFAADDYQPLPYSFVSFEGFLNAKLLVEILRQADATFGTIDRHTIAAAANQVHAFDLGIGRPITFSPTDHQALDQIYYMTVQEGRFIPLTSWQNWAK